MYIIKFTIQAAVKLITLKTISLFQAHFTVTIVAAKCCIELHN